MTRAVAVLLLAGCAQTEAGFFCERIAADTPLSSLPTRELVPASNKSKAFWAIHGRWLWDDVDGACCANASCADASHCEALLARLRVSVLDSRTAPTAGMAVGACVTSSSTRPTASSRRRTAARTERLL